jgi:hypothetical protein
MKKGLDGAGNGSGIRGKQDEKSKETMNCESIVPGKGTRDNMNADKGMAKRPNGPTEDH